MTDEQQELAAEQEHRAEMFLAGFHPDVRFSPTGSNTGRVIVASRQKRVEAGLLAVQEVEQERDECRREFEELETLHRGLNAEHDALKLAYARLVNEVDQYRKERDYAVARRAEAEAVFNAVLVIMEKHRTSTVIDETAPGT